MLSEHHDVEPRTSSNPRPTSKKPDSLGSKNQSEKRYNLLNNERSAILTNENTGSVNNKKSWTNEKFEKLYEPVTATDLKRKRQMKQIRNHLRSMGPELDK